MATRVHDVVRELRAGALNGSGAAQLRRTRMDVVRGWRAVGDLLLIEGRHLLADEVVRFANQMPPPRTEKELSAADKGAWTITTRISRTQDALVASLLTFLYQSVFGILLHGLACLLQAVPARHTLVHRPADNAMRQT